MKKILLTTIAALLAMALNAQVSVWDGTAEPWTHGSGTPKSEDEMKSEDFVSLLNTDEEVFFMDTYGYLNDGYPILKWQHESHVGVDETDWNGNVSVYPNPTDGVLTINGENLKELEVVNILGQTVLKASGETGEVTVLLENHPSGIYLLKLTDAKGGKQTVKIVVKH